MSRPTPPEARIGARLRAARQARGLTLDQVAAATELTKGFISRLERDEVSPSVASLVAVAGVLGLGMGELFDPPSTQLVRAGTGAPIAFGGQRVHETLLTPGPQRELQVIHSRLEPGGTGGADLYTLRSTVEFVYVVSRVAGRRPGRRGDHAAARRRADLPGPDAAHLAQRLRRRTGRGALGAEPGSLIPRPGGPG